MDDAPLLTSQAQDGGVLLQCDLVEGSAGVVPNAVPAQALDDVHRAVHLGVVTVERPAEYSRGDRVSRAAQVHPVTR